MGSLRTQRATREGVRVWVQRGVVWSAVTRTANKRMKRESRSLHAWWMELSLYVKTVLKSQKVHEIGAKNAVAKNFARCARRRRRPAKNFTFPEGARLTFELVTFSEN